jgi:hypothetical protein
MKNGLIFILYFTLLTSCESGTEKVTKEIEVDINAISEFASLDSYLSVVKCIPLETKPESLIGKIEKIVQYQRHYYILDTDYRNNVLHFDHNGKFIELLISEADMEIYKINRVTDFDIKEGKIFFIDNILSTLFIKDIDSRKINRYQLPFTCNNLLVIDSNNLFIYAGFIGLNNNYYRLHLISIKDMEVKIEASYLPFDSRLENGNLTAKASLRLLPYKEKWIFHEYGIDTIYMIDRIESEIFYLLSFPDNTVKNFLYDIDFQENQDDFIRSNNLSLKSYGMYLVGDLLSFEYFGNRGDRQLIYNLEADTIVANCNYLNLKNEKIPIGFYWFPVEDNSNQAIAFLESEHILDMPEESIGILNKKCGLQIKQNDNPVLTIMELKK